jgi:hypothetical protein
MNDFAKHVMLRVSTGLLLLVGTCPAYAQNSEGEPQLKRNSLTAGTWALQFQVGSNLTLTNFQGAIISIKRQLTPNQAIRLGVGGSLSLADNTSLNSYVQSDTSASATSSSGEGHSWNTTINLQYLFYANPEADVNMFFGAGVLGQYSRSYSEADDINSAPNVPSSRSISSSESHATALGIAGLLGVEWFAFRSFSLHAEYGALLRYSWGESRSDNFSASGLHSSTARKSRGWDSGGASTKFGVSVYF